MTNDASIHLQALIDRIQRGDKEARRELLERACQRLRRLAARLMHDRFPALQAHHELDSVVHETWLKLVQTLDKVEPPTVADFFGLAAHKIHQVLLTLADRQRRLARREALGWTGGPEGSSRGEPADTTHDPARLAVWTEFHARVASLSMQEQTVFEMHYYLDLPQVEIARLLNLHPRKVSYLWIAATDKLTEGMTEADDLL